MHTDGPERMVLQLTNRTLQHFESYTAREEHITGRLAAMERQPACKGLAEDDRRLASADWFGEGCSVVKQTFPGR